MGQTFRRPCELCAATMPDASTAAARRTEQTARPVSWRKRYRQGAPRARPRLTCLAVRVSSFRQLRGSSRYPHRVIAFRHTGVLSGAVKDELGHVVRPIADLFLDEVATCRSLQGILLRVLQEQE